MKTFAANPTDVTLLSDYTSMMTKLGEENQKFQEWKNKDLNSEETKYYLEVNDRISKKMVEAGQAVQ